MNNALSFSNPSLACHRRQSTTEINHVLAHSPHAASYSSYRIPPVVAAPNLSINIASQYQRTWLCVRAAQTHRRRPHCLNSTPPHSSSARAIDSACVHVLYIPYTHRHPTQFATRMFPLLQSAVNYLPIWFCSLHSIL